MGAILSDLHLLIMLIVFIVLAGRIQKAGVKSRAMSWIVSGFIVFFLFFQYPWFAVIGAFALFGYYATYGFANGYADGKLMKSYMNAFKNPNMHTQHLVSPMGPTTEWFKGGKGGPT